MIQGAYLKRKRKPAAKAEETSKEAPKESAAKDTTSEKEKIDSSANQEEAKAQKPAEKKAEEEEEELPDLKDEGVQKATALIQGAYLKRKNKPSSKAGGTTSSQELGAKSTKAQDTQEEQGQPEEIKPTPGAEGDNN